MSDHEPIVGRPLPRSMFYESIYADKGWWGCDEHKEWSAESDEDAELHAVEPHATP